jgi:hypothetical protein
MIAALKGRREVNGKSLLFDSDFTMQILTGRILPSQKNRGEVSKKVVSSLSHSQKRRRENATKLLKTMAASGLEPLT